MTASPLPTPSRNEDTVPPLGIPLGQPLGQPPQGTSFARDVPVGAPALGGEPHSQHVRRSVTAPHVGRHNSGPVQMPLRRRTAPMSRRSGDDVPGVQRVVSDLFTPEHPVGPAPGVLRSLRVFFTSSWM